MKLKKIFCTVASLFFPTAAVLSSCANQSQTIKPTPIPEKLITTYTAPGPVTNPFDGKTLDCKQWLESLSFVCNKPVSISYYTDEQTDLSNDYWSVCHEDLEGPYYYEPYNPKIGIKELYLTEPVEQVIKDWNPFLIKWLCFATPNIPTLNGFKWFGQFGKLVDINSRVIEPKDGNENKEGYYLDWNGIIYYVGNYCLYDPPGGYEDDAFPTHYYIDSVTLSKAHYEKDTSGWHLIKDTVNTYTRTDILFYYDVFTDYDNE